MQRTEFNRHWKYSAAGREDWREVTLPHDAMLGEKRAADSGGGTNTGWFAGNDYVYEKTFSLDSPAETRILEFEGVYRNAVVRLNGELLARHAYGYTGFYVDISGKVRSGENVLRVEAKNADQPNSRWYSGAGIYRPVWLWSAGKKYILPDGIRVRTVSLQPAVVHVEVQTAGEGEMTVSVTKDGVPVASVTTERRAVDLTIPQAALWSVEEPHLYRAEVSFADDFSSCSFGVRQIAVSREEGFTLNGERVILLGACIHHDNGLLGAVCHPFAEERKIRLLKQAGYNAIRSAHNPCSKALLDACDRLGMLVMDELYDGWYIHKTRYDYADCMEQNWREDLKDMIAKDVSHPSVVLYSLGNEVGETAQKKGYELAAEMAAYCHALDDTRPVTCGVNIFFNYLSSLGFGVYTDKKTQKKPRDGKKKLGVGSEFFNNLAGLLGADFMKFGATLHGSTVRTREVFARLDVAGYNYGIRRYEKDLKRFPGRIILGTETFCSDAYTFYDLANTHPAIIGDFVWAGMDYLGEVGIGAWEYRDYAPDFGHGVGWITAGSGVLDVTGKGSGALAYTRAAFAQDSVRLAVVPVHHTKDKHSPSSWRMTNALESWSWQGWEGKKAKVEVYARAAAVALYCNGKEAGRKKKGKNGVFRFTIRYEPGTLQAVAKDENGQVLGERMLRTAGEETVVTLTAERESVTSEQLCYVRVALTDGKGIVKPLARDKIRLHVEGGRLLAAGSACPYYEGNYVCADASDGETDTYFGEALAIVQPLGENVVLSAESVYGSAVCRMAVLPR